MGVMAKKKRKCPGCGVPMDAEGRALAPRPSSSSLIWGNGIERPYGDGCRAQIARSDARHTAWLQGRERLKHLRLTCRECRQEKSAEANFRPNGQSRTGFEGVCLECKALRAARAREEIGERVCAACLRTLAATANFMPNDSTRTGYHAFCNDCRAFPKFEFNALLRSRFGPVWDESRELWDQQRHEIARGILGGHYWGERAYSPGQKIYALADPTSDRIYYVGHSGNLERRMRDHLKVGGRDSNVDKDAWIAELRVAEMKPRLVILEDVRDSQTVREREARWILEQLRRGEPLTNWQAYFQYLSEATTAADFNLLTEPVDSERWRPLLDAWQLDLSARS